MSETLCAAIGAAKSEALCAAWIGAGATVLGAVLAVFAALVAGWLAWRAGQNQANETRAAAVAQVSATRNAADAQVREMQDQLGEMKAASSAADERRTYAAAWVLRSEASRLAKAAEYRRRQVEPFVRPGARPGPRPELHRSKMLITVSERVRAGQPGIELLTVDDQYLVAELIRAVDECNALTDTLVGSSDQIPVVVDHVPLLQKIETFADKLALQMLNVMDATRR